LPKNAVTGRAYSGANVLILWGAVIEHGFPSQSWLTFRQALSLGGNVRKGERGTGEEAQTIPFLKRFTVFNSAQCENLPDDIAVAATTLDAGLIEPQVEALIKATGIDFRIGGNRAFYLPTPDYVQVPPPQAYFELINWHRTALHERAHASGAPHRLNRDLSGAFGTNKYAFEELVAEISAAFCCAALGIVPTVRHADRPAGRQRRCAESRVRRVYSDAAPGDAVSRPASRWNGGEVGRLADRCARVWHLRDAAFCEDDTPRPGGGAERYVRALEQWADRRTDQQTEDPQASHVWPRQC
jgi:antirestriction protein ArdC